MIAFYGRTLKVVLRYQTITLLVAVATLVLTVLSVHHHSEGIFPGAGYGRDSGHFAGAADDFGSKAMAEKQQELAKVILQDPAVESLSSFIGADGTNTTTEQRTNVDQFEAAGGARPERVGCDSQAAVEAEECAGHSAVTCSRCRTSRWMTA